MSEHAFTISHPDESGAFNFAKHEPRKVRWRRFLARGRKISTELEHFAAESRTRLAAIDREFPEDTG